MSAIPSQNVTVTKVRATLGREATIKCRAENLVGQKTVSKPQHKGPNLIKQGYELVSFFYVINIEDLVGTKELN